MLIAFSDTLASKIDILRAYGMGVLYQKISVFIVIYSVTIVIFM